jgi:hypothetical protein
MEIKEIKKLKKNLPRFFCKICDFECYMKCDWDRHISRPKHLFSHEGNENVQKKLKKTYNCDCGKIFNSNSGLWKHKKKCLEPETETENVVINEQNVVINEQTVVADKDLIMMLVKQNSELLEVLKNGTNNINNSHNNINSHNKTFNLQFFLNETCKDAMNIMDFVDSIKLQLTDLEKVGEIGYVEGISNIITKNLKALDVTQRPIHCTDKKREVMYIKDEDKWEKADDEKKKLRKVIKKIASKNQRLILKFQEKHPDCGKASSLFSDQFNKIIVESMGGSGDNDVEKEDKIIRKISSVTTINKE